MSRGTRSFAIGLTTLALVTTLAAGDPAGAERKYKIGRKLAAEGSSEAVAALQSAVKLDPAGPLADDASVEIALIMGAPRWPEQIGTIDAGSIAGARSHVDTAAKSPTADRAGEAKYYRALLSLEADAAYDLSRARVDLISVATAEQSGEWASRARYVLAWLHERQGQRARAAAAYQRVLVDFPERQAASRARVGGARLMLRDGNPGAAARMLQEALDTGAPPETQAGALRELAVRSLMPSTRTDDALRTNASIRNPCCLAAMPDGGLLLGDRRQRVVIRLDAAGVVRDEWSLEDLQAVAVGPSGTAYAAAGTFIRRLDASGQSVPVSVQGDFAPVSSFAASGGDSFWLLDRKGQRVGQVAPGDSAPRPIWSDRDVRLASLAWDGVRLVGVDLRARTVVTLSVDGTLATLVEVGLVRPVQVSADLSGRVAVLDVKAGMIHVVNSEGLLLEDRSFEADEIERPSWAGLGLDGALHMFDTADGAWVRHP